VSTAYNEAAILTDLSLAMQYVVELRFQMKIGDEVKNAYDVVRWKARYLGGHDRSQEMLCKRKKLAVDGEDGRVTIAGAKPLGKRDCRQPRGVHVSVFPGYLRRQ